MILIDIEVPLEHVQVIRSNLDLNQLRNVEMFKMNQFEPISGKKL
jgi:hypothetical protein